MYNMRFESTQSRGRRIEQTMNDIAWESNMPEDNLVLKEYELPTINSDDILPLHKPIKNTLQQFMELREEICEEESNHLSRRIDGMELEKGQPFEEEEQEQDQNYDEYPQEGYSFRQSVQNQLQEIKASPLIGKYTGHQSRNLNYPPMMSSQGGYQTQSSQDPRYMEKLAKALENTKSWKGKLKYSQKFSYPSSSTFLEPKKRNQGMSQMSGFVQQSREDIEDLEDIEEDGVYVSNIGQKKLKLEMHIEQPPTKQYTISFYGQQQQMQQNNPLHQQQQQQQQYYPQHNQQQQQWQYHEQHREKEIEIEKEKEKGLMETLEKALRKPGNQSPRKWMVKIISSNTVCGISSVEFINFSPESEDKNPHYAIINSAKQYYPITVAPNKKYCLLNPRLVIDQMINNKRVYCVDRIEELGK